MINKDIPQDISKNNVMSNPFFIKSINVYFIPFSFNILIHIIPASAPTGVRSAPILEPIMVAYTSFILEVPDRIDEYIIVIGILFTILQDNVEEDKYNKGSMDSFVL